MKKVLIKSLFKKVDLGASCQSGLYKKNHCFCASGARGARARSDFSFFGELRKKVVFHRFFFLLGSFF